MRPTYKTLEKITCVGPASVWCASGSSAPEGNPRMYKYFWRVFSEQSPWEGDDFFIHAPALCPADCEKEVQRLLTLNLSCLLYGFRRPRKNAANPWNMNHPRWKNVKFAVSWEEDVDPVVIGGHK